MKYAVICSYTCFLTLTASCRLRYKAFFQILEDENINISVQAHFLPETVQVQFLNNYHSTPIRKGGYGNNENKLQHANRSCKNHSQFSLMLIAAQYNMVSMQ